LTGVGETMTLPRESSLISNDGLSIPCNSRQAMPDTSLLSEPGDGYAVLRIVYVLSYRDPNYIRSLSLLRALTSLPNVQVTIARNSHRGPQRYIETLRSLWGIRSGTRPDAYILGFRGHEIFWPVRLMTRGRPLVFDAMMSPYSALHEENKAGLIGKLLAPMAYLMERLILRNADLVLTDTQLHCHYYARTFAVPQEKVCALPVGAIEQASDAATHEKPQPDSFSVLFYGSFLPLHGVMEIVKAAAALKDLPIRFDFIGGSAKQANMLRRQCMLFGVTQYTHRQWVSFRQLLGHEIPKASLCLGGPFGGTPQARRVITGKTSQCLALGKATVIGRIDEDYGFADRVNCLLIDQADPGALADAIRWAYENRGKLSEMGARGRSVYDARLSVSTIAEKLLPVLRHVVATHNAENPA
jgi:glycosyltransferase involved in cell wall biosynthesis